MTEKKEEKKEQEPERIEFRIEFGEGIIRRGGLNLRPKTQRPPPPLKDGQTNTTQPPSDKKETKK